MGKPESQRETSSWNAKLVEDIYQHNPS
ncbi:uncharacterized protein METZ01_LOCUS354637, partial [marine metagenome]